MTNAYEILGSFELIVLAFARRDVDAVVDLFGADCILVGSTGPVEVHVGRDAVREVMRELLVTMPNVTFELVSVDVDEDLLCVEFLVSGSLAGQIDRAEHACRLSDVLL